MIYKPSPVSLYTIVHLTLYIWLMDPSLIALDLPISNSSQRSPASFPQVTSNLITNNPFVPQNNELINQPKKPTGPQSSANKPQVLQKYLQFKSIAIINKKKYFSIFNKRTNKSFWISEGETIDNFRITFYNSTSNTISITDGLNTEIIPITKPNETPMNVINTAEKQIKQKVAEPKIPSAPASKDKQKTLPRRRVVPAKR